MINKTISHACVTMTQLPAAQAYPFIRNNFLTATCKGAVGKMQFIIGLDLSDRLVSKATPDRRLTSSPLGERTRRCGR